MAKFIIAIMGTALIVAGGFYFLSPKLEPEAPTSSGGSCIEHVDCVRACVAIVDLNNQALMNAKRIDSPEKQMLKKSAFESCGKACVNVAE